MKTRYHQTPDASQGNAFTVTYGTRESIWDRAPVSAPAKRKHVRTVNTKLTDGTQQRSYSGAGK